MVKQTLGALVLAAASVACSGRYEVGSMDAANGVGGSRGASGGAAVGGSGASAMIDPSPGMGAATGSAGQAMASGGAPPCVASGAPPKLTGPFAEPQEVWRRIAMLTYGEPTPPPSQLPATTTYAWAGTAVSLALEDAQQTLGSAPGAETFLRQALGLKPASTFRQHWGALLSTNNNVLNVLLLAPLVLDVPDRVGIFTEPSWLLTKTTISSRGAAIDRVLFGYEVPTPPAGVEFPQPNPDLPDRAGLALLLDAAVCISCHSVMDPPGFALGHFAADGSYRELDHGVPIDATGSIAGDMYEGPTEFDGIADFGQKFAGSCTATRGISSTFLRAALVINGVAESEQTALVDANVERVAQAFVNGPRTYEALVKAYIQSPAGLSP